MKKAILGAALCSAAIAFASPANADTSSDFWNAAAGAIIDWLLGGGNGAASTGPVEVTSDFLDDSTNALILGATGIPTPNASYIADATHLYLDPNGYDGTTATTLALTTPETDSFASSVQQGENDLINAIVADYNAGEMGCNASGVCSDPLTIFTYSQSSALAALAEHELAADNIPSDALRFVMVGANPSGVPDTMYPTEIYNIDGDTWALPGSAGTSWEDLLLGIVLHDTYLGLTPAEINSATTVVDGLTTIHEIPTLTMPELWTALLDIWSTY